jgi:hypothetical protein
MGADAMNDQLGPSIADPDNPVILVGRIGKDIQAVRWFADIWSAQRNHAMLVVTADGVCIYTRYLHEVPQQWLDKANSLYITLRDDPSTDVSHMATHVNSVAPNGPLVPVGTR